MVEIEKMRGSMIKNLQEREGKIQMMEVELEEERVAIEDLGMVICEMTVWIESGKLSEGEMREMQSRKLPEEMSKVDQFHDLKKKKKTLQDLEQKKIELKHQCYVINQYLKKYKADVKQKEMDSLNLIVVCNTSSEEDEGMDNGVRQAMKEDDGDEMPRKRRRIRASIVSNTFEHAQT